MKFIKFLFAIVLFLGLFFINNLVLNLGEIDSDSIFNTQIVLEEDNEIAYDNTKSGVLEVNKLDNVIESFTGTITGYGPDCEGCTGSGNVACRTKRGAKYSLVKDDIYYTDDTYGSVRILAAAHSKFPCGTIIRVTKKSDSFIGIVLDTGGTMRNAWKKNGLVWIDVAFKEEATAAVEMPINRNVLYEVLRYGWKDE